MSKDELLERLKAVLGDDNTSDEALELYEAVSDLYSTPSADEWRQKFEENDKAWRERYRDRFLSGSGDVVEDALEEGEEVADVTDGDTSDEINDYEDLFLEESEV